MSFGWHLFIALMAINFAVSLVATVMALFCF